jgi:membrane-bound ClpP family serine protease
MNLNAKELIAQEIQTLIMSSGHHSMVDMEIKSVSLDNKSPILEEREKQNVSMEKNWREKS